MAAFIVTKDGGAPETAGDLFDLGSPDMPAPAPPSFESHGEIDLAPGGDSQPDSLDLVSTDPTSSFPPTPEVPAGGSTLPPIGDLPEPASTMPPVTAFEADQLEPIDTDISPIQETEPIRYRIRRASGKVFGPFDEETVKRMLAQKQLNGDEDASTDGVDYQSLGSFEQFAGIVEQLQSVEALPSLDQPPQELIDESIPEELPEIPAETLAPSGIEFAEPPQKKAGKKLSPRLLVGIGIGLLIVLGGIGLGFTDFGYFGYRLLFDDKPSTKQATDEGDQVAAHKPIPDSKIVEFFNNDTYLGYQQVTQSLKNKFDNDDAGTADLELLGLSYAALLRNYGAQKDYLKNGRSVVATLKKEAPNSTQAKKVDAAFTILSDPGKAALILKSLTGPNGQDQEAFFLSGWAHAYQKKWKPAAEMFERSIVLDDKFTKAYHALGDIQSLQGNFEEAFSFYQKAISIDPNHVNSAIELARILIEVKDQHLETEEIFASIFNKSLTNMSPSEQAKAYALRAKVNIRAHKSKEAFADLNKAINLSPSNGDYLAAAGNLLLDLGEYKDAQSKFNKALKIDPKNVDSMIGKGRADYKNGDIVQARVIMEKAMSLAKDDPRPHYYLGKIAEQLDEFDKAKNHYLNAKKISPNYVNARVALGLIAIKEDKLKQALEELSKAIKVNPKSAVAHNALAEIYLSQKNVRLAMRQTKLALENDPNFPAAHLNLGKIYSSQGKFDKAQASFDKVAEISPKYEDLALEKGIMLLRQKSHEEALKMFEEAIQQNPKDDRLYVHAGIAAKEGNNLPIAIKYFQSATGINNANTEACYQLGLIFQGQNEHDKAIELYSKVIDLNPKHANAHYRKGLSHFAMDNTLDAMDELREAIKLKPNHIDALIELGKTLASRREYSEAIKYLNRVARKFPKKVEVLIALGDAFFEQGLHRKALKVFLKAKKRNPKVKGLAYRLGRAYDSLDKTGQAIKFYQMASRQDADDPMPQFYLGYAYKANGKSKKAIESFERYLELRPDAPDIDDIKDEIYFLKNQ
jgi:tetratricopeptide (TPR) repeat protein